MTTPKNRAMRRAIVILTIIYTVLVAAVFAVTSNEVNTVRGDFCVFAAQVQAAARQLPQAPGRVHAEQAYTELQARLGC